MKVAVTGATGFVGAALVARLLAGGHAVTRLVRRAPRARDEVAWDPARGALDPRALDGVDAAVHLSGASIARRWTPEIRREIRASRLDTTRTLAAALARVEPRPRVLVSMSAAGWYGDRGDEVLDETAAPGRGWLAEVARDWEAAADPARAAGIRVVHPRMGLVVGAGGGVLAPLLLPFRFGLGGPIGDGRAWWSWVALDDVTGAIVRMLEDAALAGPVNLAAPAPVRNAEFARALGRALRRPAVLPVPAFALRLAFGEAADEALLASTRLVPARLAAAGFAFRFPELEPALRRALDPPRSRA